MLRRREKENVGYNHETFEEIKLNFSDGQNRTRVPKKKRGFKNNGCVKYYKVFSENTSLHGLKFTTEKRITVAERLIWVAIISGSLCLCSYLIAQVWKKWNDTPVIVSFSERSTPIEKIPFPAVTICPIVKSDPSKFNYTSIRKNLERNGWSNISVEEQIIFNIYESTCDTNIFTETESSTETFFFDESIEMFINISMSIGSSLVDFYKFYPILTEMGLCYTRNMLDGKDIYSEIVPRDKSFFENGKNSSNWSRESGYSTENFDTYPKRAFFSGIGFSKSISLEQKQNITDVLCSSYNEGFKMHIHPPDTLPRVDMQYIPIPLNSETFISLKPNMIVTSNSVKNYPPTKRQCYFENERKLDFFKKYNERNCKMECESKFIAKKCDCVPFLLPRDLTTRICTKDDKYCVYLAKSDFFIISTHLKLDPKKQLNENSSTLIDIIRQCDCLPSCVEINYDTFMSQNTLKVEKLRAVINDSDIFNYDYSLVTFSFHESHFFNSKRSELYGIFDFLANCGGLLGLCLGFSIVSLTEIVYFFIYRPIAHRIRKMNRV